MSDRFDIRVDSEVGRLRGYDDLPSALPPGTPGAPLVRRTDAPVEQGVQPVQAQDDLCLVAAGGHEG